MHVVGVWVNYPDWEKQMVIFELVHEAIEQIIQAEKIYSKKTGWQVHRHRKNYDMFHDSYIKLKGRGGRQEW